MPDAILQGLNAFGVACLAAYLVLLGVKYRLAHSYAATHLDNQELDEPVTVLQAILSGDPTLENVLRENLLVCSEKTKFSWLVDQDDAVGRELAQRLAGEFPGRVEMHLCPAPAPMANPKTFKLHLGLAQVTTPYVAVLDDDTSVSPGSLPKAIAGLSRCEIYTGLPRYVQGEGWWSLLLAHFVNNNSILTYLPMAHICAPITINGMFYVMRTDRLREMGGFEPILPMLCDDYALARLVKSRGGRIGQSIGPVVVQTTVKGAGHYIRIMHRWMRFAHLLLFDQPAGTRGLILLLLGLGPILLWAGMLAVVGGRWCWLLIVVVVVMRHLIIRKLHRSFFGDVPGFGPGTSLISELLQPIHVVHALFQSSIRWRTRRITTHRDGTFQYLPDLKP